MKAREEGVEKETEEWGMKEEVIKIWREVSKWRIQIWVFSAKLAALGNGVSNGH